jgi:hypothetical protein
MDNQYIINLIRTAVGSAVGALCAFLLTKGVDIPVETQTALIVGLTGLIGSLYTVAVNYFATNLNKRIGWLLGYPKTPKYK